MKEVWKDIPKYEGVYQASDLGRIRSLDRLVNRGNVVQPIKGRILKQCNHNGYLGVSLHKEGRSKSYQVHQLVAMTFLNHKPCGHKIVVDHINNNKQDNNLKNLQLISHRENISKSKIGKYSFYTGVSFDKSNNKYIANIQIDGKKTTLGRFNKESNAVKCYNNKLKELKLC